MVMTQTQLETRTIHLGAHTPDDVRAREAKDVADRLASIEETIGRSPRGGSLCGRIARVEHALELLVNPSPLLDAIRRLAPSYPQQVVRLDALQAAMHRANPRGGQTSLTTMALALRSLAAWGLVSLVVRADGAAEPSSTIEVPELGAKVVGVRPRERKVEQAALGEYVALSL